MSENGAKISVYKSALETTPFKNININDFLKKIKSGWLNRKDEIKAIRMIDPLVSPEEKKKYEALKKKLPGSTISGCFKTRNNKSLEVHSGYIAIDIDRKEDINLFLSEECTLQKLKDKLQLEPWVFAIFVSVGGRGLCCIVKIEPSAEVHEKAFYALEKYFQESYGITIDSSCKDESRFRYISSDLDLYYNSLAVIYNPSLVVPIKKVNEESTKLLATPKKVINQETFNRVKGIVEKAVEKKIILKKDKDTESYVSWRDLGYAISHEFGDAGRDFFHQLSAINENEYDQKECDLQYTKCLNSNGAEFGKEITIATFFYYATKAGLYQGTVSNAHQTEELKREIDSAPPDMSSEVLQNTIKKIASINKETEKSLLINRLSEKTKIGKNAIKTDLKDYKDNGKKNEGKNKDIICAKFPGLVDVVLADTGETAYLIKDKNGVLNLASKFDNSDGGFYVPPKKTELPFELPLAENAMEYYKNEDHKLFEDLKKYFKRFSYLPEEQWLIIIMFIFLTYLQDHEEVHYLPYLSFFAVPERGKSKTGKAMTYVSYRGIHLVELREANLFRYAQNMGATLFFDIMNLWKKAVDNKVEDILLLRYEKGAQVSRVLYPEKGAFEDMQHYDIFGSTIFATNEAVDKILETRCIPLTMPNKPGRYEDPEAQKAQELKERLTAWRARIFDKSLPEVEVIPELNGRLWDITKPLLQVCRLVYSEGVQYLEEVLINISAQKKEEKGAYIEGQIVNALAELSPLKDESITEWNIWTSEVLNKLNEDRSEERKLTAQYLGKKLKAIGINKRKVNGRSELMLNRSDFNMLLEQYGIDSLPSTPTPCSGSESSGELVESG